VDVTVDGNRVFAATGGRPFDPAWPSVLFIHGAGMDHTVWALQTRYFAHHARSVLAVDLPGHGRSGGVLLRSIADMTAWIVRVLDAVGVQSAALVGHSMGALIALEVAAWAPARVRSLALLGVAERMPVHPDLQAAAAGSAIGPELVSSWPRAKRPSRRQPGPGLWMMGGSLRLLEHAPPARLPPISPPATPMTARWRPPRASPARRCCCWRLDRTTPPAKATARRRDRSGAPSSCPAPVTACPSERASDAVIDALSETI
jgi:pimeloyl-ACP methyl ester carboxylesterase